MLKQQERSLKIHFQNKSIYKINKKNVIHIIDQGKEKKKTRTMSNFFFNISFELISNREKHCQGNFMILLIPGIHIKIYFI